MSETVAVEEFPEDNDHPTADDALDTETAFGDADGEDENEDYTDPSDEDGESGDPDADDVVDEGA